jgi:hypothetical protein
MSEPKQSLANHGRYVPLYHFVCLGLIVAFTLHALWSLNQHPSVDAAFQVVLAAALGLVAWFARAFALTAQDRVIRLELALRVQRLAPELAGRFTQLTPAQFTALRFAGDGELPALLRDVLDGKLTRGLDIKKRITDWQGDHLRV